jgi:hypothetical protein
MRRIADALSVEKSADLEGEKGAISPGTFIVVALLFAWRS